jgi:hypothetical protein
VVCAYISVPTIRFRKAFNKVWENVIYVNFSLFH